jgi:hypothetical protein
VHAQELMGRLQREFGLGECPMARLRLFARLARAAATDERVLVVVRAVALESKGKKRPGHWFCSAVTRRLAELGLADPVPVVTRPLDDALQAFSEGGA